MQDLTGIDRNTKGVLLRIMPALLALLLVSFALVPGSIEKAGPMEQGLRSDNLPDIDLKGSDLTVIAVDSETGAGMPGARVYLDGVYTGITGGVAGALTLDSVLYGEHSVRVLKKGFIQNTSTVQIPDTTNVRLTLFSVKVIPLGRQGPNQERLDIVFVASRTQYDCIKQRKVQTDHYTKSEDTFRRDAEAIIEKKFPLLSITSSDTGSLQGDIRDRFNFFYYWDPGDFADAFDGCAGTLPGDFWQDAPFTDVAVIVYPEYTGPYIGPPCEPVGCSSGRGAGTNSRFKFPVNAGGVFIHEAGHSIFGLMDTYCGETYYKQNDPSPNVWSSSAACTASAQENNWDPEKCRQIVKANLAANTTICEKNFWRYDEDPDIMYTTAAVRQYGTASSRRILQVLDTIRTRKL